MYILNKLVFCFCCFVGMKYFTTALLFSVLLAACNPDKNRRADPEKIKFTTTDDAELFFKNLRQQNYDKEELPAARLDVFRHSDRTKEPSYPFLQLAMVVNWRNDEAYMLLEPNEKINTDVPVEIRWIDKTTGESGVYTFDYGNKEEHLRFAGELYGSILDGHELEYLSGPEKVISFMEKPKEREIFRISMFDFYRLTGNI